MGLIKICSFFILGNLLLGSSSLIFALILKNAAHPITYSILVSILFLTILALYFKKKIKSLALDRYGIFIILIFFIFGFYVMQKSLSYSNGNFEIASNQYFDFGNHIPVIRSFSLGDHIPPIFPYYANTPNTYHFMFDYLTSLYEKLGLSLDLAFNVLSAGAFVSVFILIYYLSYELFEKKKVVGILSVLFFFFNGSLSFIEVIKKYGLNLGILSNIYHHDIYLGNGPSGSSIVSIFWNFNTYLSQRPFLFGLAAGLLLIYFLLTFRRFSKKILFLLALFIGILPLWHMVVFISLIIMITMFALFNKKHRQSYIVLVILSLIIALPQLLYTNISGSHILFRPGFLISDSLSLFNFMRYWVMNLGFGLVTITLGFLFSGKRQKLFFLSFFPLFILPNLFQLAPEMFDNHKFFNMFIVFANIYSSYFIYLLLKKKIVFKIIAVFLIFLLTFSGVIDFFVIKNDVKTKIADYPADKFESFILKNIPKNSVFLSNKHIYDPINLVGRESYLGESHYLFTFGLNPDGRIKIKNELFTSFDTNRLESLLKQKGISYIALYRKESSYLNQELYKSTFKKIYEDDEVTLLATSPN